MKEAVGRSHFSGFISILRDRQLTCIFLVSLLLRLSLVALIKDYELDSYVRFSIGEQLAKNPLAINSNGVFLPFFQYLISFLILLGGNLTTVRVMSAIAGSLTIIPVYKMSMQFSKTKRLAKFCMMLVALNPILIVYSSLAMSESLYVLLVTLSIYSLVIHKYAWATIPLTLAVLTRYESWILLPAIFLFFIWKDKRFSSEKQIPILASCIAIIGWLWINKQYYNDPFVFLHNLGAVNLPYRFDVATVWSIPESLRGVFNLALYPLIYPVMYVPIISALLYLKATSLSKSNPPASLMITICLVYNMLLTITQMLHANWGWGRHFLPLIPIYTILGGACFSHSASTRKLLLTAIASVSISTVLVYLQVAAESAFLNPT
jgi:Gpi18-like mannosyltransferase